jgi:hypothetical protein
MLDGDKFVAKVFAIAIGPVQQLIQAVAQVDRPARIADFGLFVDEFCDAIAQILHVHFRFVEHRSRQPFLLHQRLHQVFAFNLLVLGFLGDLRRPHDRLPRLLGKLIGVGGLHRVLPPAC